MSLDKEREYKTLLDITLSYWLRDAGKVVTGIKVVSKTYLNLYYLPMIQLIVAAGAINCRKHHLNTTSCPHDGGDL